MQKFHVVLISLLFSLLLPCAVCAADFDSAYDLFLHWEADGYPPYVCSVFSTDGSSDHMSIVLKEDSPENRDAIRCLLDSSASLAFLSGGAYSHDELEAVHDAIAQDILAGDEYVTALGTGWTAVDGVVTGFGESGREERVILYVDSSAARDYAAHYHALYGDAVVIVDSLGMDITAADTALSQKNAAIAACTFSAVLSAAMLSVCAYLRRKGTF